MIESRTAQVTFAQSVARRDPAPFEINWES